MKYKYLGNLAKIKNILFQLPGRWGIRLEPGVQLAWGVYFNLLFNLKI